MEHFAPPDNPTAFFKALKSCEYQTGRTSPRPAIFPATLNLHWDGLNIQFVPPPRPPPRSTTYHTNGKHASNLLACPAWQCIMLYLYYIYFREITILVIFIFMWKCVSKWKSPIAAGRVRSNTNVIHEPCDLVTLYGCTMGWFYISNMLSPC